MKELQTPGYDVETIAQDKQFIAEKLGISVEEFDNLINGENKTYKDYKNSYNFIKFCASILRKLGKENKQFR